MTTTPAQYKNKLRHFIGDVRKKYARSVLTTSIIRRYFDETGKWKATYPDTKAVSEVEVELLFAKWKKSSTTIYPHEWRINCRSKQAPFLH